MADLEELEQAAERRWLASWLIGPTYTRYDELPVQQGDMAPEVELPDNGRIALAHRYQYCEDFPPKTVLVGANMAAEG